MTDRETDAPFSEPSSRAIAALNDRLRTTGTGGRMVVTAGLAALGKTQVDLALAIVAVFNAFDAGNDPHGEHDCATVEFGPETLIWKIDYYDRALSAHSPNPADPSVTERVMTVMLAEEY
ncbi:MAG: hypothetical protein JWQ89_896 [Devosia sp.]|uniref:DUF3768 domain-containing protein n=1 Tax=Devosia sp. TaxID=1871048 RepID=UPI002630CCC4|nr:DUF3768 domain-containing protein [Devosia sp.]MDB5539169.1 hypothetical protein [Devosia sp.]